MALSRLTECAAAGVWALSPVGIAMSVRLIAAAILVGITGAARAQPVGIDTCDAFLTAYEQCAASSGVPAAARPGLQQGITSMRDSFRSSVAGNPRVAATLRQQCLQMQSSVRQSLNEAFKCAMPEATVPAGLSAPPIPPRREESATARPPAPPSAEQRSIEKVNAYVEVQNDYVGRRSLAKGLAEYRRDNERVLKPGAKPGGNNWYHFGFGDYDSLIEKLEAAIALPTPVPELDGPAAALLAAMKGLNPVVKTLDRYQESREFNEDSFKLAREQDPIFLSRARTLMQAADAFGDALFAREIARDEKRLAGLPDASLARRVLATSLIARKVVRHYEALGPGADTAPFLASIAELSASNKALYGAMDALSPKPESSCSNYAKTLDSLIGYGRDVARDIKSGSDPSQPAERFGTYYNNSVRDLERCQEREARARA